MSHVLMRGDPTQKLLQFYYSLQFSTGDCSCVQKPSHKLQSIQNTMEIWCREGESNPHSPFGPADFKSAASANFAIPARLLIAVSIAQALTRCQLERQLLG